MSTSAPCRRPHPELDAALTEALAKLGDTETAVAATLLAGGWRGKPLDACKCPVAVYLTAMGFDVAVDNAAITTGDGEEFETPTPIADFIMAFDSGRHETLDSAVRR